MNSQHHPHRRRSSSSALAAVLFYASTFVVSRPSRRWCCSSAASARSRTRPASPGLYFKMAVHRERGDAREARPRSRPAGPDHPLGRPAEPRGRRLRALPDLEPAAVLSRPSAAIPVANQRLGSFVNSSMRNVLANASRDAIVRTERGAPDEPHPGGREPAGAEPRRRDHRPAADPRRPAGGEQPGGVPAHADRAPARGRGPARQRPAAGGRRSGPGPSARRPSSSPRRPASRRRLRGQGDAEKNRILAEAFGRDAGLLRLLPLDAGL